MIVQIDPSFYEFALARTCSSRYFRGGSVNRRQGSCSRSEKPDGNWNSILKPTPRSLTKLVPPVWSPRSTSDSGDHHHERIGRKGWRLAQSSRPTPNMIS